MDFQSFYWGSWVFVTVLHGYTLIFHFTGGHTVISAVFSALIVLLGLWEIRAMAVMDDAEDFQPGDINAEPLVVIVALHLLFCAIHMMFPDTHGFHEVRAYWVVAAAALCLLICRIDAGKGASLSD